MQEKVEQYLKKVEQMEIQNRQLEEKVTAVKEANYRRIICFMMVTLIVLVSITSCSSNSSILFKDPFLAYMRNEGYIEEKDGNLTPIILPSGTEIYFDVGASSGVFSKDKAGRHAVLHVHFKGKQAYDWVINRAVDEKKQDLADIGEYAIMYAKAKGWNNTYDLYINLDGLYGYCTYVYNYETDALYISSYEDMWIDAYRECGTWSPSGLDNTKKGQQWLIDHGLGTIKHGEFEYLHNDTKEESYHVYIYEGVFHELYKDNSDRY